MEIAAEKARLRSELLQELRGISNEEKHQTAKILAASFFSSFSGELAPTKSRDTVALYKSRLTDEFPLEDELVPTLIARGWRVAFPKISEGVASARNEMEMVTLKPFSPWPWTWGQGPKQTDRLLPADGGRLEVIPASRIKFVIVPGLGFTKDGHRLGRGAGFYDRYLGSALEVIRVALVADFQMVSVLPLEANDEQMDWILTPTQRYQGESRRR